MDIVLNIMTAILGLALGWYLAETYRTTKNRHVKTAIRIVLGAIILVLIVSLFTG